MNQPEAVKVCVTGLGAISAIGANLEEIRNNLVYGNSGIQYPKILNTFIENKYLVGEIPYTNQELSKELGIKNEIPRTTLLGIYAVRKAIKSSRLNIKENSRIGLITGTTVAGMDKTETHYKNLEHSGKYIQSHPCGFTSDFIANELGITGYTSTISTACSSAANAIMTGARLIKHKILDAVIAGGSDALSAFTLSGFSSLMILDKEPCKPFSKERQGLNLGEAAGFIVLESEQFARNRKATILCHLNGYSNKNDAYHQTASSPSGEGAYLTMTEAISGAGIEAMELDYINAHGTGTENNDLTESIALNQIFGTNIPHFGSTKSFTGHCLGAAGGIEAVISILSLLNQEVYANLNFRNPIEETNLTPIKLYRQTPIKHVLSNSFGFGGCDTSLLFSQ